MNTYKKIALLGALLLGAASQMHAAVPCASSGILNVGVLPGNQPYSAQIFGPGTPFGFDVDLVRAIAALLGYQVNFIVVADFASAAAFLLNGTIDVFANSDEALDDIELALFGGVVTDMSHITNPLEPQAAATSPLRGYLFNKSCCNLMFLFESAITALVENGTYAALVQKQRQDPLQAGFTTGMGQFSFSITGPNKLVEPLEFHSTLAGTIPATGCTGPRPALPQISCIAQFAILTSTGTFTFTGPTGIALIG